MSKGSKFRFTLVLVLLAGAALALSSCGGGGGGGGGEAVVTLTDTAGNPTSRIVPNSSAVTSLSGLRPYTQYDITVRDGSNAVVSYLRLTSDGSGVIPDTVLAYNLGAGNYTFDVQEVTRTRQGDSYVDSRQATTSGSFTVAAAAGDRILEIVDQAGQLRTSFTAGEGVYVQGSGLAASTEVDVYVCLDQARWNTGDPLNDVSGEIENTPNPFPEEDVRSRALSGDAERVTTDAQGNLPQMLVWPSAGGAGLAFDVVVDVNRDGVFDQGDVAMDQATVGFMVQAAERQAAGDFIANISIGANGARKDVFAVDEDVYGLVNPPTRMQLGSDRYVKKYVVAHKDTWNQGDALVDVSGPNSPWEADTVQSGCTNEGRVLLWPAQLTAGQYDVIIDVNRNDVYDKGVDILDGGPVVGFTVGQPPAQKKWTFLVYLDGDNNLDGAGVADMNEMEQAGSSNDVNIVVQWDRSAGATWTTTRRYYVTHDTTNAIASTNLQDLGELNMADPNTLRDFVNWAIAAYPADHYALVLWNHGSGVRTRGPQEVTRDVCWDDTNGGSLSISEVRGALGLIGAKLDVLGYDACLMGMTEVAYEMRSIADYSVFSQDIEPGAGWPYDNILNALKGNPNMSAAQLAAEIVTDYGAEYPGQNGITQSAAQSAQLDTLANAVNDFAGAMIAGIEANRTALQNLVGQAQRFAAGRPYPDYRDLYHFAQLVHDSGDITGAQAGAIQTAAQAVMTAVTNTISGRETHSADLPNAHGLSIWLPDRQYLTNNIRKYSECLFAHDNRWDEFLAYLWGTVIRVELTWGEQPNDLDSHLWDAQDPPNHVAYYNLSINGADLDRDDTTSYGPENVTITALIPGTRGRYDYAVYRYAGGAATAPAVVRVFRGASSVPERTYSTSAFTGSGEEWWHVFSINPSDGSITSIDQMLSSVPLGLPDGGRGRAKKG